MGPASFTATLLPLQSRVLSPPEMLFPLLASLALRIPADDPIDKTWAAYLEKPPARAVELAANLSARADAVAAGLGKGTGMHITGEFDVVCCGERANHMQIGMPQSAVMEGQVLGGGSRSSLP